MPVWAEVERPSPSKGMDDPDHLRSSIFEFTNDALEIMLMLNAEVMLQRPHPTWRARLVRKYLSYIRHIVST
jgi:hypothetical protein